MPILNRSLESLPEPVKARWAVQDLSGPLWGQQYLVNGDVRASYQRQQDGTAVFVEIGGDNDLAQECIDVYIRDSGASAKQIRYAITALALSSWQVVY